MYFLLFLALLPYVYGGSKCPQRANIYPCICIDRSIGKSKFDTTFVCRGLNDGSSLLKIERALEDLEINTFLLYDAYWKNDLLRSQIDSEIPINVLSSFRIEEIKIVDSGMSSFACPKEYNCRTNYVKRFTVINSTLPERSPCDNVFSINSWISCPGIAEEVIIDEGFSGETSLKADFFPEPMPKLKTLYMPRNHISRIDRRAFSISKFPSLQSLDLSYNSIRDGKNLFSTMLKLRNLDLSHNPLRTIPDFQYLPHLQTLKMKNAQITALVANDWQNIPVTLRNIDLSENAITCSCGTRFISSTFHMNAYLLGECTGPHKVKGKTLRKAARFLIERCDEEGNIGVKRKGRAPSPQQ